MARKKTPMNKIREILRLHTLGFSERKISDYINVSRPVISGNIKRFEASGLSINDVQDMDDNGLLDIIGTGSKSKSERYQKLVEQFPKFVKELGRTGVNLTLLWEEYRQEYLI